jgi:hypothetical protein
MPMRHAWEKTMNRRCAAWGTLLVSALALGACIDANDSLVGEVEPDDGTGGTSGTSASGGRDTGGTSGNGATSGSGATSGTTGTGGTTGECTPGTTIPASDSSCNTCTCQDDHSWLCTRTACPECVDGETRRVDRCNSCTCEDGFWTCTEQVCSDCDPGDIVPQPDGCNRCICTEMGTFRCTDHDCGECPAPEEAAACTVPYYYIRTPAAERCCFYPEPCTAPVLADDSAYTNLEDCMAGPSDYGRLGNCDGDPFSSYETDLMSDVENCGACGTVCVQTAGASVRCEKGQCIGACLEGFSDCNGDATDGCEYQGTCGE